MFPFYAPNYIAWLHSGEQLAPQLLTTVHFCQPQAENVNARLDVGRVPKIGVTGISAGARKGAAVP